MSSRSAFTTTNPDTDRTEMHTDNIESFADLGLDLPFERGDAIYDKKRNTVRIPRAVAPSENDGFRVYSTMYEVRETPTGDLKITDSLGPSLNSSPMKLLLAILDEETTEIVNDSRVTA